jgi:hypothetical protein
MSTSVVLRDPLARGLLTVPLGALLGVAIAPGEKWRPIGVKQLSVGATASRSGGVGLQVTLRF